MQVDWQGLGQSDIFYSWVITLHGIAILFTSLVLMCLPFLSFFRVLMVFNFLILITSGLTYALAFRPWVIMASWCIRGAGFGMSEVLLIGYVSVTPKLLPRAKKKIRRKSTFGVKDRYLAVTLIFRTIGWPIGLGSYRNRDFYVHHACMNSHTPFRYFSADGTVQELSGPVPMARVG